MSFLGAGGAGVASQIHGLFGGGGSSNGAATGLGHLIGADPSRVSAMADRIGGGLNQMAAAGGAALGYQRNPQDHVQPVNNHLQLLDPSTLQGILRMFGGQHP